MKCAFKIILVLLPTIAFADVNSDRKELEAVGKRIMESAKTGQPDFSCISPNGRDFCKTGALHFNRSKEIVNVSGEQFRAYIDSLKRNDAAEKKCLDPVFKNGKFQSKDAKENDKAIRCIQAIEYSVDKPDDIDLFYFKPTELFSQHNVEAAVSMLTVRRDELQPPTKGDAEDEPITGKQFSATQAKQKKAEASIKEPPILPANTYVQSGNKHVGKRFKLKVIGDGITGLDVIEKGKCGFFLVAGGDTGFSDTGEGTYHVTVPNVAICSYLYDIQGQDVSAADLIVEYSGPVGFTLKNGVMGKAAGFKVIKRY